MGTKTISFGNVTLTGYESDYILKSIEKSNDFYEGSLLKKWTPLLHGPQYILDVGANIGNHTVFWATTLPIKRIISFEPFPDNYKLLCKNVEQNRLSCVKTMNVAVGEKSGTVEVKEFDPENYGGTSFQYTDGAENTEQMAQVCTLDEIIPQLGIPRVDFIKIDTEGFEFSVLKGMQRIIDRDKPVLWIEISKETAADVYDMLDKKGYTLVEISGANTLFIQDNKMNQEPIPISRLLEENMTLLSKVNTYYSNYEKSKEWLAAKDRKLQEKSTEIERFQSVIKAKDTALQDAIKQVFLETDARVKQFQEEKNNEFQRLKQEAENEAKQLQTQLAGKEQQILRLEEQVKELSARAEQLRKGLSKSETMFTEEEQFLQSAKQQLLLLNTKLQQAQRQNKLYEEKLYKIYGTWYGKIALKAYKFLKKVKNLIIKK